MQNFRFFYIVSAVRKTDSLKLGTAAVTRPTLTTFSIFLGHQLRTQSATRYNVRLYNKLRIFCPPVLMFFLLDLGFDSAATSWGLQEAQCSTDCHTMLCLCWHKAEVCALSSLYPVYLFASSPLPVFLKITLPRSAELMQESFHFRGAPSAILQY